MKAWPDGDSSMQREVVKNNDVYSTCMARTNLYINDELLELVIRRYKLRTKTEAVDMALRHLAGKPMTTTEALAMRGARAIGDAPPDQLPS
jgi:Arc/MetJ family transcription regulator